MTKESYKLQELEEAKKASSKTEDLGGGAVAHEVGFDPDNLIGQVVAGRYTIESRIGRGGMGIVYLAQQQGLDRKVVVKVLSRALSEDAEAISRFEREAMGLSKLQHPNIVTIYDFGREDSLAYIAMEYVEGGTLSGYVRRNKRLTLDEFTPLALQILDALHEAHQQGIVHRDIKPSNIMLCERQGQKNVVKVLDFGLAKLVSESVEVTQKQNLVGSVAYLAPEQILGFAVDQRADVYSLGVLFYYMLSGKKPFRGEDDIAVLYQHVHKEPEHLGIVLAALEEQGEIRAEVSEELIDLVHQCLAKEPKLRPSNAGELLDLMCEQVSVNFSRNLPWIARSSSGTYLAVEPKSPEQETPSSQSMVRSETWSDTDVTRSEVSKRSISTEKWISVRSWRSSNWPYIAIGVAVGLAVLALVWAAPTREAVSPPPDSAESHSAVLTQIEAIRELLDQGQWKRAKALLAGVRGHVDDVPSLGPEVEELVTAIEVAQLLDAARAAESLGQTEAARKHYRRILEIKPESNIASRRLAVLLRQENEEVQEKSSFGQLSIHVNRTAEVFINEAFMGHVPGDIHVPPGEHRLRLSAPGYQDYVEMISIKPGTSKVMDVDLERRNRPGSSDPEPALSPENPPKDPAPELKNNTEVEVKAADTSKAPDSPTSQKPTVAPLPSSQKSTPARTPESQEVMEPSPESKTEAEVLPQPTSPDTSPKGEELPEGLLPVLPD